MLRTSSMVLMLAALVSLLGGGAVWAQGGPARVAVAPVVEREVIPTQTFVSTVMPSKRSEVGSAVDGRVSEFPVNEGDFVKKGETLAQLRIATIELERDAAQGELDLRKAELAELKNGSLPDEIRRSEALLMAAKAGQEFHQKRLKRTETLFARKATSEDNLQLVVSEAVKANQDLAAAEAAYKLIVDGPRPEKILQAEARVVAQRALVNKLEDQIKKYTIVAPFDGYVVAEHTEVGEWVKQGQVVAEVVALGKVEVQAHVLENHVRYVKNGMSVPINVPALGTEVFTGEVMRVIPQADLRARTFPINIRVENAINEEKEPLLQAGMLARATLPTGAKLNSAMVSKDALVLGGAQPVVFVVDKTSDGKGGKVRPVPVALGVSEGRLVQVQGDLKAGQWVVLRGNERLRPGQDVVVNEVLKPDAEPKTRAVNPSGK